MFSLPYRQFTDGDAGSEKIKNKVEEEDPNHDKTLGQGFKAFVPNPKQEEASTVNTSNIADGICSYRGKVFCNDNFFEYPGNQMLDHKNWWFILLINTVVLKTAKFRWA